MKIFSKSGSFKIAYTNLWTYDHSLEFLFRFMKKNLQVIVKIQAPGERFELSNPCEYALYGLY